MTSQYYLRVSPGKARSQDRWPEVPPMMAVDNVDFLAPDKPGRPQNETGLRRARSGVNKRNTGGPGDGGKTPVIRPDQPHLLAQLQQAARQFDALIIRSTAGEHRIQMG